MSLTTARVYTPSGRSIQALGIAPDIEVVQSVPAALRGTETVAGEARIERHLPGGPAASSFETANADISCEAWGRTIEPSIRPYASQNDRL